jgi:prevent-host-death family protein
VSNYCASRWLQSVQSRPSQLYGLGYTEAVHTTSITNLREHLKETLELATGGEPVTVTDRGRPIVRITAVDSSTDPLQDLIAAGKVTPPTREKKRIDRTRVTTEPTESVADLLTDQRNR